MMTDYWIRIKANIGIYASKKSSCLLDGSYRSIYKGNGMNFEDLREYVPGDDVRSIDWKASARSRQFLVKQFVAEKKHNIMLVFDNALSMTADTETDLKKYELGLLAGGSIGYMAAKNGDNVGAVFDTEKGISYFQAKTGLYSLERLLAFYQSGSGSGGENSLEKSLQFILQNLNRSMVMILVTDEMGIHNLSDGILRKLCQRNDLLVLSVEDAYVAGKKTFDLDAGKYFPSFVTNRKRLKQEEIKFRRNLEQENDQKLLHHGISCARIRSEKMIPDAIVALLHRHRNLKSKGK